MDLIIASNNEHKLVEIRQILGDRFPKIISLRQAGIEHETVEDGKTFLENALKKAREISQISGCCALADDSGICVNALGGAPGIYSARYAGDHGDDNANNQLLLENLKDKDDRSAYFACAVALVFPDGRELTAEGRFDGVITHSPSGENGFGYDPLFFVPEYNCTSADMSPQQKNQISHRKKALENLLKKLDKE